MAIQRILKRDLVGSRGGGVIAKGHAEPLDMTVARLCARVEALERDVLAIARADSTGDGLAVLASRLAERIADDDEEAAKP